MGRQDRSPECIPEDDVVDITLDNYLVNLLREEEIIEAIRMVDWEKASKMSHRLEMDLQKPWHYLNKHHKIHNEKRVHSFRNLKQEVEEVEAADDEVAPKVDSPMKVSPSNKQHSRSATTITPRKKRHALRSPNGTCTWSSRFYHIIQEDKNAAKDKQIAEQKIFNDYIRHRIRTTPENQFYEYNMKRRKDTLRKLPEELAYRPFDAVKAFSEYGSKENLLKMAVRRILIVVTQH
jgi:hypothetical protein